MNVVHTVFLIVQSRGVAIPVLVRSVPEELMMGTVGVGQPVAGLAKRAAGAVEERDKVRPSHPRSHLGKRMGRFLSEVVCMHTQ